MRESDQPQKSLPVGILLIVLAFACVAVMSAFGKGAASVSTAMLVFFQNFISLCLFAPWILRGGLGFTLFGGIVTQVYFPTVDRPQIRDLQYLITDGNTFFHEEKRDLKSKVERFSDHSLGYRCTNSDPGAATPLRKKLSRIRTFHASCNERG